MKQQVGIMLILLATSISAMAQNERDAFRYAQYSPTGTARYSALAGSMGAFGSDFSCLSAGNPAGIGLFKRFEFTITPALSFDRTSTVYNGEELSGVKTEFNLNNLGVVFAGFSNTGTGWKNVQFATGLNNLARYNESSFASGQNDGNLHGTTNFFDYIAASANGTKYTSLSGFADEAFYYWLIDTLPGENDRYYSLVDANFHQQQIKKTNGYLNEYVFSVGGNYNDKLFLGATLGIPFFNYYQSITYTESRNPFYDSLIVSEEFRSKATGINLKLGVIYQPVKYMRVGAAFHTPTLYPKVKEDFHTNINVWDVLVDTNKYDDILVDNGLSHFNYRLHTPSRAMANIAFIYKSLGFINVDYEYIDYTFSKLYSDSYSFSNENTRISKYYKGTHTIRAGGELNLSPLVLRLGYAYSSNPYNSKELEKDGSRHTISGGIGIKGKSFFADLAYMYRFSKDKDVFYDHFSINPYTTQAVNQLFALTVGWKIRM